MMSAILEDFTSIRGVSLIKIKEAKDEGQKVVGIYCTYCPQEMILAAGAIPVSLCGTSETPIADAETVLPRNLCPLIKSSYGFAVTDTCPFFHFSDLIIGETTCDGKKKMFEIMQEIKPVYVMQLPHLHQLDAALELWIKELRRLRSTLEEELDVEISDEKLWDAIRKVNHETMAVKAICDLNKKNPPVLNGLDLLTVTWSRNFSSDKEELFTMLNELQQELATNQESEANANKPRVLLTGCPVGLGSEKVIRLVEESGGLIVAMENCSGYKTLELQSDTELDDPIIALAQKYMEIPCSCMSPNPYRFELLERMLEEFQVDAVVDLTWQACHTYNIEAFTVGNLVRDKGLPYLHLESDYSSSDLETLKVRIEALLEMVV
ncbi:MAG TPA: 2-hydroxyacyl-CoA dehydratase [Gelria sp.]|nr:2-hydroxyacyl-CoA dehydratase [Gelria sp.]